MASTGDEKCFRPIQTTEQRHEAAFQTIDSLEDRLFAFIHAMRERAELVPPGPERDELLKKVKKAENAVEVEQRVSSLGTKDTEVNHFAHLTGADTDDDTSNRKQPTECKGLEQESRSGTGRRV